MSSICIVSSQLEILSAESLPENTTLLTSAIKELAEKGYEKALSGGFAGFRTNFDLQKSGISLKTYLETCRKTVEMTCFREQQKSNISLYPSS